MADKDKKPKKEYGPMQKIGAVWAKSAKSGLNFYEGRIATEAVLDDAALTPDTKLILFKVNSDNPQAPAFNIFIRQPKKNGTDAQDGEETPF